MDETKFKILRKISEKTEFSQRSLSKELGVSLGKLNYCLKALTDKGFIKISNFRNSENKAKHLYLLTPKGLSEKTKVTIRFMRQKIKEYDELKKDLQILKNKKKK